MLIVPVAVMSGKLEISLARLNSNVNAPVSLLDYRTVTDECRPVEDECRTVDSGKQQ